VFVADVLVSFGFCCASSQEQYREQMHRLRSCALDSPDTRSLRSKGDVFSSLYPSN